MPLIHKYVFTLSFHLEVLFLVSIPFLPTFFLVEFIQTEKKGKKPLSLVR